MSDIIKILEVFCFFEYSKMQKTYITIIFIANKAKAAHAEPERKEESNLVAKSFLYKKHF